MITLYTMPGACSLASHITLIWSGAPYDIEIVEREELISEDYLKINPLHSVPVAKINGKIFTQNVAILPYIASLGKEKNLGPIEGDEIDRLRFYQMLGFLNSDFHSAFKGIFRPQRLGFAEEESPKAHEASLTNLKNYLALLSELLKTEDFLVGQRKTACDAYFFVMLLWLNKVAAGTIEKYPHIKAYFDRFMNDEAVQKAMAAEGLA